MADRHAGPAVAAVLALAMAATPAGAQSLVRCTVAALDGTRASVWTDGAVRPARAGGAFAVVGRIVTGPDTRIALDCEGGRRVVVAPDTDIDFGRLAASEGYAARLLRGLAGFVLPLLGADRFEVRTPTAVASVRSTEWLMEVGEDGATAVFVREGAVAVEAPRGGAVLEPGEGVDVTATGVAGPVKTWGAGRVARLSALLGAGWE